MPVEEIVVESGNPYRETETGEFASPDKASAGAPKNSKFASIAEKIKAKKEHLMYLKTVPTLRNYVSHRYEFMEMMRQSRHISLEDEEKVASLEPLYRKMLDNCFLTKWGRGVSVLGILESGVMENMFKNSSFGDGCTWRDARFTASEMMFGHGIGYYEEGNSKNRELEKYGCLSSKNISKFLAQGPGNADYCTDEYESGVSVCFVLNKNHLKDRTTICFADSLSGGKDGYAYSRGDGPLPKKYTANIDIFQFRKAQQQNIKGYSEEYLKEVFNDYFDNPYKLSRKIGGPSSGCGYVEAQYHGEVTIANGDMKYIIMRGSKNDILDGVYEDKEVYKKIIDKANKLGIDVLIGEPYGNKLFRARFDNNGELVYDTYESEEILDD